MRLVIFCSVLFLSSGCATVEGWFGGDEEQTTESPSPADTSGDTAADAAELPSDTVADTAADTEGPGPISDDCDLLPTLDSLQERYLTPSCTFSSCHDASNPAGALDLTLGTAYDSLVDVSADKNGLETLVVPGDPDGSYLVKRLEGTVDNYMPSGATEPMDPECRIATLRAWILAGAQP
jgi:hypothetical protein